MEISGKMNEARRILKQVFGYDRFISLQADVIENILNKRDTLVVMPTGGGKSLCYQIPALLLPGLTVVISPLISLMKDQVEQLSQAGVEAVVLNSSLSPEEYRGNVAKIRQGKVKLLYLAPETLLKPAILSMLASGSVDCLTIDEAHCISEWGHDFRPEYRQMVSVRQRFPAAVCMGLTATATRRVREDIKKNLGFSDSDEFIASFNRENLFMEVVPKKNPYEQTLRFIRKFPGQSGIVYCFSRKQVDGLYLSLKAEGFSVAPYHAGLTDSERSANQDLFIRDDVQIVVATIAFGMGIDKPNVRFVVHYDLPRNIESYYQEIGRSGRDGLQSHCLLLFGYGDIRKVKYFIDQKEAHERRVANLHLNALLGFLETRGCRRIPLLEYFGETFRAESCGMCDNCLKGRPELKDLTLAAQKFLSCVKRTGEKFGAGHIIDVLRGSGAKKVLRYGHDKLSTHGIGKEYSREIWMELSRQLIHHGFVSQDMDVGSLRLTPRAWDVLKGKDKYYGSLEEEKAAEEAAQDRAPADWNRELFEILRSERKRIADRIRVPPYVIFSDRTLQEMARFYPESPEEFLNLHGVGKVRFERYGAVFLDLIAGYCRQHPVKKPLPPVAVSREGEPAGKLRHVLVGEMINSGRSVSEIMAQFRVKADTVLDHLYKYVQEGNPVRCEALLSFSTLDPQRQSRVLASFAELGTDYLRPVFDAMAGEVGYGELKLLRLVQLGRLMAGGDARRTGAAGIIWRQLICLANSRKYSGRCVAGKEWLENRAGGWVRPVGGGETGELAMGEIRLADGSLPRLLDIVRVPLSGPASHPYQKENFAVSGLKWYKAGKFPLRGLETLCDPAESLWTGGFHSTAGINDRIPQAMAEARVTSTLLLIRPDEGCRVIVEEDAHLLKKVRAEFRFRGIPYRLMVTDPVVENRYVFQELGAYPLEEESLFLTVSIGEPYEGYCYKLVAGILCAEFLGENGSSRIRGKTD